MPAKGKHGPASRVSASERVVEAVAKNEGVHPTALPPLYDAVDPDALDGIVRGGGTPTDAERVGVTFAYHGYEVTVWGDGRVDLAGDR